MLGRASSSLVPLEEVACTRGSLPCLALLMRTGEKVALAQEYKVPWSDCKHGTHTSNILCFLLPSHSSLSRVPEPHGFHRLTPPLRRSAGAWPQSSRSKLRQAAIITPKAGGQGVRKISSPPEISPNISRRDRPEHSTKTRTKHFLLSISTLR